MSKSSKRILSIFLSLVILVTAIVVYSSFVVPAFAKANSLRGELASKQTALDEQRQISEEVKVLLERFLSIPDLETALSNIVPNKEEVSGVFNEIYAIADLSGLKVDQFNSNAAIAIQPNPSEFSNIKSLGTVQVEVNVIGSYSSMKTFIDALERDIRIMEVTKFKLQNFAKAGEDLFSLSLTINAFYQS